MYRALTRKIPSSSSTHKIHTPSMSTRRTPILKVTGNSSIHRATIHRMTIRKVSTHKATSNSTTRRRIIHSRVKRPVQVMANNRGRSRKKGRIIGFSVGGAVLVIVIAVVCVLVFTEGSVRSVDKLAEGIQHNIQEGRDISEYLCETPKERLVYGAFSPYEDAETWQGAKDELAYLPVIDDIMRALSHNPNAKVKVTKKDGSTAVLDYHYSGNDVKGKISNSSLSATGLTRQQSDLLVDDTFNRQPTITYHAEKRNGKWCVLNK